MADLKISELAALAGANLAAGDLLPIVDVSASETKKITVTDLVGNATTLIADATIPGAKILFGSGSIAGSSIATGGIGATQLADDAVTAAKLGNESTVDLVTTLPGSGAFTGQLALDTDDLKVYCWDGSSWQSIKAAGSINAVVGGTSGIVNITVSTSGDTVTISTTLDNTSAAAQFLAGPTASSGAASYRTIAAGDLPTATSGAKGAVQVNGSGLTMSGDTVQIDNTVAVNNSAYHVVQYTAKGLVTAGRTVQPGDLPLAGASSVGGVYPGSGLSVAVDGQLNHTNTVATGTYTKLTVDAQGHVTAGASLVAGDIPEISTDKLTSGFLPADRIASDAVTGAKLANSSTAQFGASQPVAEYTGQLYFNSLTRDIYIWDGNVWQPIGISVGEIVFAGTYDASTNLVASVTSDGTAVGLSIGQALPAAAAANNRYYLVVAEAGTGTSPAPTVALSPPDIILSNGNAWTEIDVSQTITSQVASNVSVTPTGGISSTNVQAALEELDTEKLPTAGGTMSGELLIGIAGSLAFEGSTANAYETYLAVVDPTADRTITFPDVSGTVITTGDTGTVTNAMLATISTADKVSLSALNIDGGTDIGAALADADLFIVDDGGAGTNRKAAATRITDYAFGKVSGDITITSGGTAAIGSGVIVNADVNASAAIAGTKISPDFGSQDIATTGKAAVGGAGRAVGGAVVPQVAIETLGQGFACVRNSADTSGGIIALGKSRGTSTGAVTAVQLDDILGEIRFAGANGTDMTSVGAHIRALVDGEVGTAGDTTDMPTRLVFSTTPDGSATASQRLAIASTGRVTVTNSVVGTPTSLVDGATITPDFAEASNWTLTIGGNRTLANPTNLTAGQSGTIVITNSGGNRTLAYGSYWKFPGGTAPTLTTTASAVDVIAYYVESATRITARMISDVK
jgi:hypothetical protein